MMQNTTEMYLGIFLVICGFIASLLNLRRIMKKNTSFSTVLLSENIVLMCIGVAFISKSMNDGNVSNINMYAMEERAFTSLVRAKIGTHSRQCNFGSILMSYGPFIISLVNSFISLVIDNYMHYRMMDKIQARENENNVREINTSFTAENSDKIYVYWKKYFSYIAIAFQWIFPILIAIAMYPMDIKEVLLKSSDMRSASNTCMTMVGASNDTCSNMENETANYTLELRNYVPESKVYVKLYENEYFGDTNISRKLESIIENVRKIVSNIEQKVNLTSYNFVNNNIESRDGKSQTHCMKICYLETKNLLLYMFLVTIISYFVPITISTIVLTKIHAMKIKKSNLKMFINRELLYNILFWTPVMFDKFLSLILCTSTDGMRTTIFTLIANIYQGIKNFMNTKYLKDNSVIPV